MIKKIVFRKVVLECNTSPSEMTAWEARSWLSVISNFIFDLKGIYLETNYLRRERQY